MMVGANISPEQLLSIAERTIMEADTGMEIEFLTVTVKRLFYLNCIVEIFFIA